MSTPEKKTKMKNRVIPRLKSIALVVLALAAFPLFGTTYSYNSMTWTDDPASPGKWTSRYADAKAYAKKNNVNTSALTQSEILSLELRLPHPLNRGNR